MSAVPNKKARNLTMVNDAKKEPQPVEAEPPPAAKHKGSPKSTPSRAVLRAFLPVAKLIAAGNSPNIDWKAVAKALEEGDKGAVKDLFTDAV